MSVALLAVLLSCAQDARPAGGAQPTPSTPAPPSSAPEAPHEQIPGVRLTGIKGSHAGSVLDVGDADDDGVSDLLVSSALTTPVAWVISTPDEGALADLASAWVATGGSYTRASFAGDVDGDGHDDLLLNSANFLVYRGPLVGEVTASDVVATWRGASTAASGDFDGDGQVDLATEHGIRFGPISGELDPDSADLTFDPYLWESFVFPHSFDPDGTGIDNLVLIGDHHGEFPQFTSDRFVIDDPPEGVGVYSDGFLCSVGANLVTVADATGDGVADLISATARPIDYYYYPTEQLVTVRDGWANDAGAWTTLRPGVHAESAAVGDLDGDGSPDLVIGLEDGVVLVYFGPLPPGDLTRDDADLQLVSRAPPVWDDTQSTWSGADGFGTTVATADLDGDGLDELVVGAPGDDTEGNDAGAVYVASGGTLR